MKIAFFGTPDFTTDFLDLFVEQGFSPSLVVTNPDRPVGRGMTLQSPAPKAWADEHAISVLQPESLDDAFFDTLSAQSWDLFIVIAYGKIIPERVITLPKYGTINLHYSLLPKYRGATPVESAILNGDTVTGITIQHMRFKIDSGPILAQKEFPIELTDTTPSLRTKLNAEAITMLPSVLKAIFDESITPTEQPEEGTTRCGKINKEDGQLNLSDAPEINDRKYRAYYGSIGTYFFHDGKRIKITTAHFSEGHFIIDEVIPENGKKMPYDIFLASL